MDETGGFPSSSAEMKEPDVFFLFFLWWWKHDISFLFFLLCLHHSTAHRHGEMGTWIHTHKHSHTHTRIRTYVTACVSCIWSDISMFLISNHSASIMTLLVIISPQSFLLSWKERIRLKWESFTRPIQTRTTFVLLWETKSRCLSECSRCSAEERQCLKVFLMFTWTVL